MTNVSGYPTFDDMRDLNDPPGTVYEWVRQDNSPGDGWRRLDNGRPDCPIWIRPMEADR